MVVVSEVLLQFHLSWKYFVSTNRNTHFDILQPRLVVTDSNRVIVRLIKYHLEINTDTVVCKQTQGFVRPTSGQERLRVKILL